MAALAISCMLQGLVWISTFSYSSAQVCNGYDAYTHCYTLYKQLRTVSEAEAQCRADGGELLSIYNKASQQHLETHLKGEGVTSDDVWTSGFQPNPDIFWGNPESMWRWIDDCKGECEKTGCNGGKLDMAFLLDNSGSVNNSDWQIMLGFINRLIDQFEIGPDATQVAVLKFGNFANVEFGLDAHRTKDAVKAAINALTHEQENTNTYEGLRLTREQIFVKSGGDRRDAPNVAIVLTDGKSTRNSNETIPEAERVRDAGVQLFVIGVTNDVSIDEISGISSPPQEENRTYGLVQSFSVLNNLTIVVDFAKGICAWHRMVKVVNHTALASQGCYDDTDVTPDLLFKVTTPGFTVTPNTCTQECSTLGYQFAGVKVTTTSGVTAPVCSCGNEFGKTGTQDQCTVSCGSGSGQFCGGIDKNSIYKTDGVRNTWAYNQPDNAGPLGIQYCGVIDTAEGFTLADETCSTQHPFICALPRQQCNSPRSDGTYTFSPVFRACVFVSSGSSTWHAARRTCQNRQGELLVIKGTTQQIVLQGILSSPTSRYYYIGLYKENHFWRDSDITEFHYVNFAGLEPRFDDPSRTCVYVDPGSAYGWRVANCTNRKFFVCQRAYNFSVTSTSEPATTEHLTTVVDTTALPAKTTTSTIPTTTSRIITSTIKKITTSQSRSSTTTEVTSSPTTATSAFTSRVFTTSTTTTEQPTTTSTRAPTPTPARSTTTTTPSPQTTEANTTLGGGVTAGSVSEEDWKTYWWLILIIGLLLLLVLILLILCCIFIKKRKARTRIYDARPIAPAPLSTVLGDSEPYEYYIDSGSQVDLVVGTSLVGVPANKKWNCRIDSGTGYYANGQGYNYTGDDAKVKESIRKDNRGK